LGANSVLALKCWIEAHAVAEPGEKCSWGRYNGDFAAGYLQPAGPGRAAAGWPLWWPAVGPLVVLPSVSSSSMLNLTAGLSPAANNSHNSGGNGSFELSTQESCSASQLPSCRRLGPVRRRGEPLPILLSHHEGCAAAAAACPRCRCRAASARSERREGRGDRLESGALEWWAVGLSPGWLSY